ncbi:Serine dehydratase alpha chain [Avibacterium paragallinarum]|uniref:Serine dehydratase alpha chain n=1 Tax=Avibacterium paragallinarum TaxID=728 RepID=A0A380X8Z2_AVIPA|nr:Serine dehydratase alpha chain [Avibacterium paragallinarum]
MNENLRNFETALIDIVQQDVVPALGCTEPISLALASATAAHYLGLYPEKIVAKVSPNLMKNGLGVAVPRTGMVGLPIAAAVGALGGDASAGLEVLKKITPEQVEQAKQLLQQHKVKVSIKQTDQILYAESTIYAGEDWVRVVIQGQHTNIILIEKNGDVLFKAEESQAQQIDPYAMFNQLKAKDIFDFATQIELKRSNLSSKRKNLMRHYQRKGFVTITAYILDARYKNILAMA